MNLEIIDKIIDALVSRFTIWPFISLQNLMNK